MAKMTKKEINASIARAKKTLLEIKDKQDKLVDGSSKRKQISDLESQIKQLQDLLK
jgi:hypothetical protein